MEKLGLDLQDVQLDDRELLIMQLRNELEKEKLSLKVLGDKEKIKYIKDLEQQIEETVDTLATEKGSPGRGQWNLFGENIFESEQPDLDFAMAEISRLKTSIEDKDEYIRELEQKTTKDQERIKQEVGELKKMLMEKDAALKSFINSHQKSPNTDNNAEITKLKKNVEEESNKRKEYESIISKIQKSHKDLFQKYLMVEQELTQQMKVSENLQIERKEAVDTLLSERDIWRIEKEELETKLAQLSLESAESAEKEKQADESSQKFKLSVESQRKELEQHRIRQEKMDSEVDLLKNHLRVLVSKSKELEEERLKEISQLSESLKSQGDLTRKMEDKLQAFQNQAALFQQRMKSLEGHSQTQKETIEALSIKLKEANDANTELNRTNELLREKLKRTTGGTPGPSTEKPSFYPKTPPPSRTTKLTSTPKLIQENMELPLSNSQRLQQEIQKITQESEGLLFKLSRSDSLHGGLEGTEYHPKHQSVAKPTISSLLMQIKPKTPERNLLHEFMTHERPKTPPKPAFPSYPNAKRNSTNSRPNSTKAANVGLNKKKSNPLGRK